MKWNPIKLYALMFLPVLAAVMLFLSSKQGKDAGIIRSVRIGEAEWEVIAVADTPVSREQGLAGRDSLCGRCAMVFRFPKPGRYGFWMKGMRFPIDIAWIRDGVIVHIERDIPADSKETFVSPADADTVIEVNAGEFGEVSRGDTIQGWLLGS